MSNKNKLGQLKSGSASTKEEICISLVGPVGCGKSALIVKYLTRRFIGEYDPFYEGCWTKIENIDNVEMNVQIKDTYDKEKKNLEQYYKWSDLMILVYSIIDAESFVQIQDYLESLSEIIKKSGEENSVKKFTKLVLLGNKKDMERFRKVSKNDVENVLRKYGSISCKQISDSTNTIISDIEKNVGCSSLNIVHEESSSCEEYEIVQGLFHKMIREYKREKEIIQNNQQDSSIFSKLPKPKMPGKLRAKSPNIKANNASELNINNLSTSPPIHSGSYGESTFSGNQMNSLPSSNSFTNTNNNGFTIREANKEKRNTTKFPFFNKILNKS